MDPSPRLQVRLRQYRLLRQTTAAESSSSRWSRRRGRCSGRRGTSATTPTSTWCPGAGPSPPTSVSPSPPCPPWWSRPRRTSWTTVWWGPLLVTWEMVTSIQCCCLIQTIRRNGQNVRWWQTEWQKGRWNLEVSKLTLMFLNIFATRS